MVASTGGVIRVCLLASLLIGTAAAAASESVAGQRPNIVVILCDDLGYGDVRCLNPERGKIPTPHIDRLASQGMIFTDAHSGSSVCTPTRYGLLTGRYAWRTRLQRGVLDGGNDEPLIAADRLTLGEMLRRSGYATACIGKWHLGFTSDQTVKQGEKPKRAGKRKGDSEASEGPEASEMNARGLPLAAKIFGGPTTRGFDYFLGCSNARTMSSLIENETVIESIVPIAMLPRVAATAVNYIRARGAERDREEPFFLYLPLTSPHTPIVPAKGWQGKSGLGAYADFVMQTDAVVGEVLDAIDAAGIADRTLVLFTSDNGCSPQAKVDELERQGHYPSSTRRGYKADIWEGGHRVPFIVRWPGQVKATGRCDQTITLTDLMATCAEIVGVELPESAGEDSVSILSAMLGGSEPIHEAVVHHSIQGRFAIRQGDWKLAFCSGSGGWGKPSDSDATARGAPPVQLYDLANDPAESNNLEAKHPEVVRRLTDLLRRYITEGRSAPSRGGRASGQNDVPVRLPEVVTQGAND
jgi:arylsulfatase A-like enzyme